MVSYRLILLLFLFLLICFNCPSIHLLEKPFTNGNDDSQQGKIGGLAGRREKVFLMIV